MLEDSVGPGQNVGDGERGMGAGLYCDLFGRVDGDGRALHRHGRRSVLLRHGGKPAGEGYPWKGQAGEGRPWTAGMTYVREPGLREVSRGSSRGVRRPEALHP